MQSFLQDVRYGLRVPRRNSALSAVHFPRLGDIHLDYAVLGFTLAVSLLTGIVFGLAPALHVSSVDIHESLKESSRGASGGGRRNRLRNLLVISEVALCFVLLIGAGLLFRGFLELQSVNKGFTSEQVLTMRLTPSGERFKEDAQYGLRLSEW